MKRDLPYHPAGLFLFYFLCCILKYAGIRPYTLRGRWPREALAPEKEGTHAVGRPSRRHVPHGVPQRMIGKGRRPQSGKALPWSSASQCVPTETGSRKEGTHAVGRTSRRHVPHGVSRRPSLTCRKRLSPPRGTCSHTQCQAPDSSPRTTRSTH